jgi:hypothetical protein
LPLPLLGLTYMPSPAPAPGLASHMFAMSMVLG